MSGAANGGGGTPQARAAWNAAIKAHDDASAATATAKALTDTQDPNGQALDAAYAAESEALKVLMFMRAPDVAGMAEKARRGIDQAYVELQGESGTDTDTLERMLSEGPWDAGCVVAALYQDALALSGDTGPLSLVNVSSFDARAWVAETEAATGAGLSGIAGDWGLSFNGNAEQVAAARVALDALKQWQQESVVRSLNLLA